MCHALLVSLLSQKALRSVLKQADGTDAGGMHGFYVKIFSNIWCRFKWQHLGSRRALSRRVAIWT